MEERISAQRGVEFYGDAEWKRSEKGEGDETNRSYGKVGNKYILPSYCNQ
jgi:hypothetical protein